MNAIYYIGLDIHKKTIAYAKQQLGIIGTQNDAVSSNTDYNICLQR